MPIGVIACAFGQQRTNTAGPSNEAIGRVAHHIKWTTKGVIAAQWEVEAFLQRINFPADKVIGAYGANGHYVTTEEVFAESLAYFKSVGVSEVVIVAQPLHLLVIRRAMKGWSIDPSFHFTRAYDRLMRRIPFDRSSGNVQWWTRGPIRFVTYLVRATLFGVHGR